MSRNFMKKFRKFCKSKLGGFLVKFTAAFLATLLVCGIGLWGAYTYVFGGMEQSDDITKEEAGIETQDYHTDDIINIALFGVDTDDTEMANGRSDSIIVVSIDNKIGEIRLSAIQRDTYVTIEGRGKDKINHAYAFGGPALAVKTLNQNFGLDISHYAVINFANLEKVIDALDGIELEVTETYRQQVNKHLTDWAKERGSKADLIEEAGVQTLSGIQVLGMSRARYNVGGTAARSEMHELILNACYAKLKTKNILEYPAVAKELLALVKTTLNSTDVINVGMKVLLSGYEIRQAVFPLTEDQKNGGGGSMINGVWYLTYNEETGNQHVRDFIYNGTLPSDTTE